CGCANPPNARTSARAIDSLADLDILDLPIRPQRPSLDSVVVVDRVDAADFPQGVLARLYVAGLVHDTRLQQQLFARPVEFVVKPHAGFIEDRPVDARRAPVAPAIERDVDAADLAAARPRKPGDDVEPFLLDRRLRRR